MNEIKILFAGDFCVRCKAVAYMYPEKLPSWLSLSKQ